MEKYDEIINVLESDYYYRIRNDANELMRDPIFLKKIITAHNPFVFDRFVKMCEFKMDTSAIYEGRNKFVKKSIDNLDEKNIFQFFGLENLEDSRKQVIASRYLSEYIVSYYFQDNFYNFMTNFFQMTNYLRFSKKDLVSLDHLKLYEQFTKITKLSFDDKIKLFNNNLGNDLMGMFYDDINIVRTDSHKELVEATLKLKKDNGIYQSDLSDKCGLNIYYLNGEPFYGFIRCISLKDKNIKGEKTHVFSQKERLGYSFSYIGNSEIGAIGSSEDSVLLYYDNIDYKNIMYVHHTDMHSGVMKKLTHYITDKENEIITPSYLVATTVNYNEVYIKPGEDGIKPTAIICYDNLNERALEFARKYNLSILIINREKYKHKEKYDDDYRDYTYVI